MAERRTRLGKRAALIAGLWGLSALVPVPSQAVPRPGDPPGSFAYRWSTDGGDTFSAGQLDDRGRDLTTGNLEAEDGVVHAVFEDNTEGGPGATNDRAVYYRRSTDGGETYTGSVRIDGNAGDSSESDVAASGGDVFVVWEDDRLLDSGDPDPATQDLPPEAEVPAYDDRDDILLTHSGDGGDRFDPPIDLSCDADPRSAGQTSRSDPTPEAKRCDSDEIHDRDPRVATSPDGHRVVVAYEGADLVSGAESVGDFTKADDIFVSISDDGGRTWKVRNHNVTDAPERQLTPDVDVSETTIHLVYENEADDELAEATNRPIQYQRSIDGGATFEKAQSLPGPSAKHAAVRADGTTVHVFACEDGTAESKQGSNWDLLYWRSADDGVTWSEPVTLAGHREGCGDVDADLAGESLHVVYEAEADPLEGDVFFVRSHNGGKDWTKRVNLASSGLAPSGHPSVSVDPAAPRRVYVAWTDDASLLMSLSGADRVPGDDGRPLAVADEDVLRFRAGTYSMVIDGSDVGLGAMAIDALARLSEHEFVLSFAEPAALGSLGLVDDADLVRFTAKRLGGDTAGRFDLFFDGSAIGLSDEDIDAVEILTGAGDGVDLYLSTAEDFSVDGGVHGSGSDVLVCEGATIGRRSGCKRIRAGFQGGGTGAPVDAFSFNGVGIQPGEDAVAYFSFRGSFDSKTASGDGRDIALCMFDDLASSADGRILRDCGKSVPLLTGLYGEANGMTGELAAIEFDY